jgi:uncharacterized protein
LPKIETGDCHVWSPEFLKVSEVVHIMAKDTFNASATPDVGVAAKTRELAPIDLAQVAKDMAATIEKAKADDPRELRKQIAELKRQVTAQPKEKISDRVVEKYALKDGQLARAEKLLERIDQLADKYSTFEEDLRVTAKEIRDAIAKTREPLAGRRGELTPRAFPGVAPAPPRGPGKPRPAPNGVASSNGDLTPARQKILNGLAFLHGIGVAPADKTQLALIVGVSPTSGGYFNNLGALRSGGLIDYPTGGTVALTEDGQSIASTEGVPSTTRDLHAAIAAKLPPAKWRIVEELIKVYPHALTKDDLAERIGVSPTSGGYFNNLGSLRSLGLLDYPRPSEVAARPVLFLEER